LFRRRFELPTQGFSVLCSNQLSYLNANLKRVMGIEPISPVWKTGNLPLIHTRTFKNNTIFHFILRGFKKRRDSFFFTVVIKKLKIQLAFFSLK
jgi:hypothetical protein